MGAYPALLLLQHKSNQAPPLDRSVQAHPMRMAGRPSAHDWMSPSATKTIVQCQEYPVPVNHKKNKHRQRRDKALAVGQPIDLGNGVLLYVHDAAQVGAPAALLPQPAKDQLALRRAREDAQSRLLPAPGRPVRRLGLIHKREGPGAAEQVCWRVRTFSAPGFHQETNTAPPRPLRHPIHIIFRSSLHHHDTMPALSASNLELMRDRLILACQDTAPEEVYKAVAEKYPQGITKDILDLNSPVRDKVVSKNIEQSTNKPEATSRVTRSKAKNADGPLIVACPSRPTKDYSPILKPLSPGGESTISHMSLDDMSNAESSRRDSGVGVGLNNTAGTLHQKQPEPFPLAMFQSARFASSLENIPPRRTKAVSNRTTCFFELSNVAGCFRGPTVNPEDGTLDRIPLFRIEVTFDRCKSATTAVRRDLGLATSGSSPAALVSVVHELPANRTRRSNRKASATV
ncbi:hypothetical protein HDK90DRAFT_541286 [Phyllosticta capitalensis]|uniref:Uncharacterized protein n=1 Tax=Phyllosticta capitalensis TaxID=121624 RepID=A0ABR1YEI0_9PEZI